MVSLSWQNKNYAQGQTKEANHKPVIIRCLVWKRNNISNFCTEVIMYEYMEKKERKKERKSNKNGFQKAEKITHWAQQLHSAFVTSLPVTA